jgi:hypothetical protein
MLRIDCPECGEEWAVSPKNLVRGSQLQCQECESMLVVVSEKPLKVEVDSESELGDDDEFEEFEDDDED